MIISVHLPKTAGTSFRHSLQDYYGDKLLQNYTDPPQRLNDIERNSKAVKLALETLDVDYENVECIHGHFLPFGYLLLKNASPITFITWMRNPVERIASNYYHVLQYYKNWNRPFHYKMIDEKWSLEQYCLCDEMRNMYSKFLWGFPLEYFDFIGITEHYKEDFRYFANKYLSPDVQSIRLNVNKESNGIYNINKSLRKKIEDFHHADMELYERALDMRKKRMKEVSVFHQLVPKVKRFF